MYYKTPNPSIVRYSMHAHMLIFLPAIAFILHALLPKIAFLSDSTFFQHAVNGLSEEANDGIVFSLFVGVQSETYATGVEQHI
jgi:hypothetical protein